MPLGTVWNGTDMSAVIRPLLLTLCILMGCSNASNGGDRAAQFEQVSLQPRSNPLSPQKVIFFHIEDGSEDRTQIDTPDFHFWRDRSVFANLAFNEYDPALAPLLHDTGWYPRFHMTSDIRRLHRPSDVLQSLSVLKDEVLNPEGPGFSLSHIYLVPVRSEYDSLRAALADHGIDGLSPVADVSADCGYARFSNDVGDRQFSVLILHEPDGLVDLTEAGDRECMVGLFARNWGIDSSVAQSLIFGDELQRSHEAGPGRASSPIMTNQGLIVDEAGIPIGLKLSGRCELARIVAPSARRDWTVDVTDACPTPPRRRAEMLSAYVRAGGAGVPADSIPLIQRRIRDICGAALATDEAQDSVFKC